MWTGKPRALWDGNVISTVMGLALCGTLWLVSSPVTNVPPEGLCQEVIVAVKRNGNILAKCPAGTFLDIVDDNVVCRCAGGPQVDVGQEADNEDAPPIDAGPARLFDGHLTDWL